MKNQSSTPAPKAVLRNSTVNNTIPGPITLLKESWHIYTERFKLYLPFILLIALGSLASQIFSDFLKKEPTSNNVFLYVGFIFIAVLILSIGSISLIIALIDKDISINVVYKKALSKILPLAGVELLTGVATFIGTLLLIVPGIIVANWYVFAEYVYLNENSGIYGSLDGSKKYIKGRWWKVFWRIFFINIFTPLLGFVMGIVLGLMNTPAIINRDIIWLATYISSLVLTPITIIYTYLFYIKLKAITPLSSITEAKKD